MSKSIKTMALFVALSGLSGAWMSLSAAEKGGKPADTDPMFYVFTEKGSRLNHYIPSGWMGDFGDLKINNGWTKGVGKPKDAKAAAKKMPKNKDGSAMAEEKDETCLQISYSGERKQGHGWAGIYWQHPANNWGDKRGGYNLTGYKKMTFWARGDKGGETIDKFFMGGISGQTEEGDSDEASVSPVTLTKEWKFYTVDLTGLDLSHIIGGFGFAANADANPDGFTLYVDEIRYEK
jgi:hypothetical protein